jgi:putative hydrolase of the HAD superfamily
LENPESAAKILGEFAMTVLFDIGNVLLNLHFQRFYAQVSGLPAHPLPEDLARLKEPYESGAIDDAEFISRSLKSLAGRLSVVEFTSAWQDVFTPNYAMWQVVRQLKAHGHRLILFSNTNGLHSAHFLEKFSVFEYFDAHHFSYEIGLMKPDPRFYHCAIERFELNPSQTIYLDDLAENVVAGRAFGFKSWQYEAAKHDACLRWLARFVKIFEKT